MTSLERYYESNYRQYDEVHDSQESQHEKPSFFRYLVGLQKTNPTRPIKKPCNAEHQGPPANDADTPLFLVPDARLSAELQREVLQTRSHPSLFRGIRVRLARSSPYRLRLDRNVTHCRAAAPLHRRFGLLGF